MQEKEAHGSLSQGLLSCHDLGLFYHSEPPYYDAPHKNYNIFRDL